MSDTTGAAQIFDRGYRRYRGERTGTAGAVRSLVRHSIRHAVGLGRPARFKAVPLLMMVMAYLPSAVFVGLAALATVDPAEFIPSYAEYYGYVAAAIYLLAGFVSPELLCSDRRNGLLGVYLASPLTRPTYLAGKVVAVLLLLLVVTLGPPLLMLIALTLQNLGPDGPAEWVRLLGQVVASSVVIGSFYTVVSLAVAATTDRITVATATVLALIPGSGFITDRLVDEAGLAPELRLLNLLYLPRAIIFRIHGDLAGGWPPAQNPSWLLWAAFGAWTVLGAAVVLVRYQTLLVRR